MDSHLSHRGMDFVMKLFVLEQVIMHQITLVTLESLVANLQQMTCKLLLPKTIKMFFITSANVRSNCEPKTHQTRKNGILIPVSNHHYLEKALILILCSI